MKRGAEDVVVLMSGTHDRVILAVVEAMGGTADIGVTEHADVV